MPSSLNLKVLLVALSLLFTVGAEAQSFCRAQALNGSSSDSGIGITTGTTDAAGNLYTIGGFRGTADFDPGPGVYNLTATGNLDMFIMKEDPSGNLVWVRQVKGLSSGVYGCFGRGVDIDRNGNVFITGFVRDSFDFDPGPAVYKLNSFGSYHTFILKLDSAGNFVWVKDIGTQIQTVGISTTAGKREKNGYLYFAASVTGDGATAIDIDPGPGVYNITPGLGDLMLEKLDSNGNFIWAKLITGDNAKTPYSLGFDSSSNVFVCGTFYGSADFDPGPAVYTLTATPASLPTMTDIFVAKYDSAGNFGWAHSFGGNSYDVAWGGAVDRFGNLLVTGAFEGTVDFDPGPAVYNLSSTARNIFTLKLRNNGDFAWARMVGSGGLFEGRAITTDDSGNVYTTALAPGGCDVDPGPAVHPVGGDCIAQKLDSSGNFIWGAGWQGDVPDWIGLDNSDSVYITGGFSGSNKDFDPGPGAFLLSSNSNGSGFILKLNQIPQPVGINESNLQKAVSIYPNPSSGIVTFSCQQSAIHRIELTDVAGKAVYVNEPGKAKTVLDLGGKAAGVYFYEVDFGSGKQRGKLVIY